MLNNLDLQHFSVAKTTKVTNFRSESVMSIEVSDNYIYVATGRTGLWVFEVGPTG